MVMFEWDWLLRLAAAMTAGFLIGFERHNRSKDAGIRTHMMVALGSCLLMLISKYGFADVKAGDPARLAAQVVSGIGFLGAGVIFVRHDVVQGLTTAAGIWATSAIGLCFGSGMLVLGTAASVMMIVVQHVFRRMLPRNAGNIVMKLKIRTVRSAGAADILPILRAQGCHLIGETKCCAGDEESLTYLCDTASGKDFHPETILKALMASDKVLSVEIV